MPNSYRKLNYRHRLTSFFTWGLHTTLLTMLCFSSAVFSQCQSARVKLQILGSGGPEITDARASSAYLVWQDDHVVVLIDTGPGSSLNFEQSGARLADLKAIVFSHFHVDHSADFPAYIKASFFTDRNQDLRVFGPQGNDLMPSASEFVYAMLGPNGVYRYLNNYVSASKPSAYKIRTENIARQNDTIKEIQLTNTLSLAAIAVHHGPIPALAWLVDAAGCKIVFSGDMSNQYHNLEKLAKNADILIAHNAIPEAARGVARNLHMPPSEIGKIAAQAAVKQLVLSHRMLRTLGQEQKTLSIIRQYYSGPVTFAEDLDVILVKN